MSRRSEKTRYISDNTINAALRSLGYDTQEEITCPGFPGDGTHHDPRTPAWEPDVIERHLAHTSDEELGSSYDRPAFIVQHKAIVQQWADFRDELEAGKLPQPEDNELQFIRQRPKAVQRAG